jgi:hypothetical protein
MTMIKRKFVSKESIQSFSMGSGGEVGDGECTDSELSASDGERGAGEPPLMLLLVPSGRAVVGGAETPDS